MRPDPPHLPTAPLPTEELESNAPAAYARLAPEYYQPGCNRTCQALREASRILIERLLPLPSPGEGETGDQPGLLLELGVGRSLLAPLCQARGIPLERVVLSDAVAGMLTYSQEWEALGARLLCAPAQQTPLPNGSVSALLASLGDPYNTPATWRELARLLAPGGRALFTVPAWEWAELQRAGAPAARFTLRDGSQVLAPSQVLPREEQRALIESAGLRVERVESLSCGELEGPLPPKLAGLPPQTPLVTAYLAASERVSSP